LLRVVKAMTREVIDQASAHYHEYPKTQSRNDIAERLAADHGLVMNSEFLCIDLEKPADMPLEPGPRILEEEKGKPETEKAAVDYLVETVRSQHKATDANADNHENG